MFKRDVAKKQFVSIPKGVNVDALTEAAAIVIYQGGLAAKARSKSYGDQRNDSKKEGSKSWSKYKKKTG
jgi:hypothetical protein